MFRTTLLPALPGRGAFTGLALLALAGACGGAGTGAGDGAPGADASGTSGGEGAGAGPAGGSDGPVVADVGAHPVGGQGVDFISSKLRERHRAGGGSAPVPATPVLRARLATSEASEHPVRLEGARCYQVWAVGVPSVRNLELSLVDEFGHTRARDDVDDAFPSLRSCPPVDAEWTLMMRVFEGYGPVGAQFFVESE